MSAWEDELNKRLQSTTDETLERQRKEKAVAEKQKARAWDLVTQALQAAGDVFEKTSTAAAMKQMVASYGYKGSGRSCSVDVNMERAEATASDAELVVTYRSKTERLTYDAKLDALVSDANPAVPVRDYDAYFGRIVLTLFPQQR